MQLSILPTLFLAATAAALPLSDAVELDSRAASFARVSLPAPANWMTDSSLYPSNIIAAYSAETAQYASAESWAAYILAKCQGYRDCTSCISYSGKQGISEDPPHCQSSSLGSGAGKVPSAEVRSDRTNKSADTSLSTRIGINSGSTGGRYWFGEVYRGGATTPARYERETDPSLGITDSIAYTIVS
ncbi:hypothetical protein PG994_000192 [Apiospora phragmitis]|uniref:Uncharacterized protein n=1 Tax=Apiospora phragmitis TaxID=2905665 RepID=A0ABR1X5K1_9PEZI